MTTPLVLLILDGWGVASPSGDSVGNAIQAAKTPHYDALLEQYPHTTLEASGEAVGLPPGQVGNSEVGHLTMGAGREIPQTLSRINQSIQTGGFFSNPVFLEAIHHAKTHESRLHLVGLVSDGGVHSHVEHLMALLDLAYQQQVNHVSVHAILDGRDVLPNMAEASLRLVEEKLLLQDREQISTVQGRYYAMDRDCRWERIQQAYENLTEASGRRFPLSLNALSMAYENDIFDEFVVPCVTDLAYDGMHDGDSILFFNFRPDRMRQLTEPFIHPHFSGFERKKILADLYVGCMATYDTSWNLPVAFPPEKLADTLTQVLASHGLKQYRVAETEKYAHVTFFFNGGIEEPVEGEERCLVPSPKVATYDLAPAMSLASVTDQLLTAVKSQEYSFILANFANPDMVGHTGDYDATVHAVEAVDQALGRVLEAVQSVGGTLLITSDHGNAEAMFDLNEKEGGPPQPNPAHTTNPVPLIWVHPEKEACQLDLNESQSLACIAPIVLQLLGLPIPSSMQAPSLMSRS